MKCVLYDGDSSIENKPAILKIKIEKNIDANEEVKFLIAPFVNPGGDIGDDSDDLYTRKLPITLKFMKSCRDDGKMCSKHTTFDYYEVRTATGSKN